MYNLLGAVIRGIAANNNDVNFVLEGWRSKLNKDHLISHLGQEHVKQFEVVVRVIALTLYRVLMLQLVSCVC